MAKKVIENGVEPGGDPRDGGTGGASKTTSGKLGSSGSGMGTGTSARDEGSGADLSTFPSVVQNLVNSIKVPYVYHPQKQGLPDIQQIQMGEFRAYWALVQDETLEFDPALQGALSVALNHEPQLVAAVTRSASAEVVLQTLFAYTDDDLSPEVGRAMIDQMVDVYRQPRVPHEKWEQVLEFTPITPSNSHREEPEGVVWYPSVPIDYIPGLSKGMGRRYQDGKPIAWVPSQYGDYTLPDGTYVPSYGGSACGPITLYAMLLAYLQLHPGAFDLPDFATFMQWAAEEGYYLGDVTAGADAVVFVTKKFGINAAYTNQVNVPADPRSADQIAYGHIRSTLYQGIPVGALVTQELAGQKGVISDIDEQSAEPIVNPLGSSEGTAHLALITGISSEKQWAAGNQWVRIFNPFSGTEEFYSWETFTVSVGQNPETGAWSVFWIDPLNEPSEESIEPQSWAGSFWD